MTDRPDPRDIDTLLTGAFGSRHHAVGARPSLPDVRRRARRRQRRTVGGVTVAAAVVGVGGVAALATRSPGTPSAAGGSDGSVDCLPGPTTTLGPAGDPTVSTSVYLEPGASTSLFPPIATSTTMVEPLTDSQGAPVGVDTTFPMVGESWVGAASTTSFDVLVTATGPAVESPAPCASVSTSVFWPDSTTTYIGRVQVLVVDASGIEGAVDEVSEMLARVNGYVDFVVVPGTRIVEQTMVMPASTDQALIDEVLGAIGVGGFDTWTPDLVDRDVPLDGVAVVVVIGADWSDRKS